MLTTAQQLLQVWLKNYRDPSRYKSSKAHVSGAVFKKHKNSIRSLKKKKLYKEFLKKYAEEREERLKDAV